MSSGSGILLNAEVVAAPFRTEVQGALNQLQEGVKLVGILSTSSAPSRFYAEFTRKTCQGLGVEFILKEVGAAISGSGLEDGEGVEDAIIEANNDASIHGILVYFPIFGGRQDQYLQQIVSPFKDVEGLHFKFHYNLYHNIRYLHPSSLLAAVPPVAVEFDGIKDVPPPGCVKSILPCTPLAVVKCLENIGVYNALLKYGDRAYGKTITVINRSEVVGRPLAALLANDGARVFSVDIDSTQEYTKRPTPPPGETVRTYHPRHVVHAAASSLQECLALSDVVVSAVPSETYKVKTEWLKDGCICINVASEKNFEKDVRQRASIYIAAVGKVTILMLLRNLLRLRDYQRLLQAEQ